MELTFKERYEHLDPVVLESLIEAHEEFLRNDDHELDHPYRLDARLSIVALKERLKEARGE